MNKTQKSFGVLAVSVALALSLGGVAAAQVQAPVPPVNVPLHQADTQQASSPQDGAQKPQPAQAAQSSCPPGATNTNYCQSTSTTPSNNCPPGANNPAYCSTSTTPSQNQQPSTSSQGTTHHPSSATAPSRGVSPSTATTSARGELPRTGGDPKLVAMVGLLLLALGSPIAWLGRPRRERPSP